MLDAYPLRSTMTDIATFPAPSLRKSRLVTAVLAVAGGGFTVIGSSILFFPHQFFAATAVEIGHNPTFLSDVHGLGALILSSGILIGLGVFVRRLAFTSALVGAIAYLSYVAARVISIATEGMPGPTVLAAMAAELTLGLACLVVLLRYRA